ncbi:MAG: DNA ligase B [Alphaproteobacteria bacterium MarineAlpha8_Bin1]|nr:MAG: DNA ligase B [Alphaproteobacteria bacterium MarineAlpha8_Bin1]
MKDFSNLLEKIIFTPSRNSKISIISHFFKNCKDPDRGFALAILTGNLKIAKITSPILKDITKKKVDPILFDLSYDYVGDLAETISLIWPNKKKGKLPSLSKFIQTTENLNQKDIPNYIIRNLDIADTTERWTIIKLISGGLRIGFSEKLAKISLSHYSGKSLERIERIWHGLKPPYQNLFDWLDGVAAEPKINNHEIFHPLMLANPINKEKDMKTINPLDFCAEWKWDGVRVQIIISRNNTKIFSRNGESLSESFPELSFKSDNEAVIDGELLVGKNFTPSSFNDLQQRLNRKKVTSKIIEKYPCFIKVYDILFYKNNDLRKKSFYLRRKILEKWKIENNFQKIDLSEIIRFKNLEDLKKKRNLGISKKNYEGIMLKKINSAYISGRPKGFWYKWKRDPKFIDAILMYAQRGHGKRSSFYSDFTFGIWDHKNLVPIGKAYSGFSNEELYELDKFVRNNTIKKFGPVREVKKKIVLEVAFDEISRSKRHKSGLALRFPRISNIRWDKPTSEVEQLSSIIETFKIEP